MTGVRAPRKRTPRPRVPTPSGQQSRSGAKSPNGLTAMQDLFVLEFLKDFNATQAAIRAGYSAKTARFQGARLLTNVNVAQAVAAAREERQERVKVDTDRLEQETERIALSDIRRLVRDGMLLPIGDIPDELAPAIASVEVVTREVSKGDIERVAKIRFWDKPSALRTLFQIHGKLNDRNLNVKGNFEHSGSMAISPSQVEELSRHLSDDELHRAKVLSAELKGILETAKERHEARRGRVTLGSR